jgi:CheY-like chemotaxis protein
MNDRDNFSSMPSPTYRSSARRRILVVDDNVESAEGLGTLLCHMGHDVQVAHDGHAALEAARIKRPHVVILDLGMRGVDGYHVLQRLRREAHFASVAFVAMTGQQDLHTRGRSQEAGFAEYLLKPVSLDTLQRLLETL